MIKIEVEKVGEDLKMNTEFKGRNFDSLIEVAFGVHHLIYNMAKNKEEFVFFMIYLNKLLNSADYEGLKGVFTSELQ